MENFFVSSPCASSSYHPPPYYRRMMDRIEGSLINVCFANGHEKSHNQHNEEIQAAINSAIFVTIN